MELSKELQNMPTSQLSANDNMTLVVNAMHLKDVLRYIKTDCANMIHGWLLSCGSKAPALWHIAMPVEEPSTAS